MKSNFARPIAEYWESEAAAVTWASDALAKANFEHSREMPFLGRVVDLVVIINHEVLAIEFKVRNWRRALKQIRDQTMAADRCYVCLPLASVSKETLKKFKNLNYGVGLLVLDEMRQEWPFKELIPAKRSESQWQSLREELENRLAMTIRAGSHATLD